MAVPTPEKILLSQLPNKIGQQLDVLVCCASFEERCRSVPNALGSSRVELALICENEDIEQVRPNAQLLLGMYGPKARKVPLRTDGPVKSADGIKSALSQAACLRPLSYLVDITTFTHESLLILLQLLRSLLKADDRVTFAYVPAKEYSVGNSADEKWLSKGIDGIRSVLGYPGLLSPSRLMHLIVLVGYESERAAKLIDAYDPAVISLGFGEKECSVSPELHEVNMAFYRSLAARYQNVHEFSFSCVNPSDAKRAIERQIRNTPGHNVVLAAMNTKISTVGAALAAFANDEIQLCYAHASQYNFERYSSPSNECYLFEVEWPLR